MKRELFSLAVEGIKGKKRSSILLMLVLVLSFAFAVITLSVTGSMNKTNEEYRYDTYGTWHGAIPKGKEEDAEFLKKNQFVEEIGSSRFYGKIAKGTSGIGTIDETFKKLGRINLQDGRFPENADEIAMEADVLSVLGYNYELGQKISLMVSVPVYPLSGKEVNFIPEILVEQEYTLCGVLKEYTDLWLLENSSQILEGAIITEAGAENLIRDAKILAKEKKVSLKGTIPHYFFTLKEGKEMQFRGEVHQWLMKTRQEPGDEKEISLNPSAVTDSQQMVYHYFYLGMILVTTLLAVVCIYMVQLQKQVRQIALFRSIGVTRGQLGRILFYETVCISIPAALLGVLTGILGTVGVLQVLFGVSKAKVYVQVPATALLFMIVIWVFGIFAVRLLVFGIALRQPLTGQIRMGYKKNGRYRRIKRLMVFGLAGVFCGVFFFGILQSIPQIEDKRKWEQNSSYNLYSENALATLNNDTAQQVIIEEMIEQMEQVPGVLLVNAYGRMFVEMKFPGMENCAFSAMYLDEEIWREKIAYPGLETEITEEGEKEIPFPEGAGVELYGIREKNWPEYFDSKKLGIDEEAFRNGEEVIVSVPVDMNGNVTYRYETYDSCGLKKGDTIELGLYGNQMNGMNMSPKKRVGNTGVKVGAINYIVEGKNHKNLASTGYRPYTILCSEKFIDRMLKEAEPGYFCSKYLTGDNFTYTDAGVYTTINAGYLSTDYVIADISAEYGIRMDNSRERYASYIQEDMQNLILIFSGSGSVCLILIMVIWNTLRLEAEEEKRSFGILQAIGMSKRQMKKRILRSSLTVGGMAVLGGWIIYVGYDLAAALQQQKFLVEEFNEFRSLKSILEMSLYHRRLDGMNLIFILGISVAAMAVIILIYYVSKRCLFEKDVLAKLREER